MGISSWLTKQDLAQYADTFEANAISFADLGGLTHEDLRDGLGIKKFSERKKILKAIERLRGEPDVFEALAPRQIDFPEGLAPDQMPTYIAHPWHSLCAEEHPASNFTGSPTPPSSPCDGPSPSRSPRSSLPTT